MQLENVVIDARDPQRLGRFWQEALGCEELTDAPGIFETRLQADGGPWLDLCFQQVQDPTTAPPRLHLDVSGADRQAEVVDRLLGLGARRLDIGQGDVPWVVLADPEDVPFCVMEHREEYAESGALAALPLDSADPERDHAFWAWLTGWQPAAGALPALRHPSGRGPLLELCRESAPKGAKNRLHLDVRLEPGEDADEAEAGILRRGGSRLVTDWGELPWRSYRDPSGNEVCVLPVSSEHDAPDD